MSGALKSRVSVNWVELLIGFLLGMFGGWVLSLWAARDLRKEADKLRKLNLIVIRALEDQRMVKTIKDKDGNPTGIIVEGKASVAGEARVTAKGTVVPAPGRDDGEDDG